MKFVRNDKRKVRATVEMTPLIDVVFQLLIFFMLSSTFVVQTSIPIEMPQNQDVEVMEHKDIAITLTQDTGGPDQEGGIFIEDVPIANWGELSRTLTELHRENPEALVLIRPDAQVPTGRTVEVIGYVTSAGIRNYAIAAQAPQQEE